FRIEGYHTYFVSATKEGASVWVHNNNYQDANPATRDLGNQLSSRAQELWDTLLPQEKKWGATVAVTHVDGVEVVVLYANKGNGQHQLTQGEINAFKNGVRAQGGAVHHTSGDVHAEQLLHSREPAAPAIGVSNKKGPCDRCGEYFTRVG